MVISLISLLFLVSCATKTTVYQNKALSVQLEEGQTVIVVDKDYVRMIKVQDSDPGKDDKFCSRKLSPESKAFVECRKSHEEYYPEKKIEVILFD